VVVDEIENDNAFTCDCSGVEGVEGDNCKGIGAGSTSPPTPAPPAPSTDPLKPTTPTLCSGENMGGCDCYDSANVQKGFKTYVVWIGELQRCIHEYVPLKIADDTRVPVMMVVSAYGV
jgi:hypothetical protein